MVRFAWALAGVIGAQGCQRAEQKAPADPAPEVDEVLPLSALPVVAPPAPVKILDQARDVVLVVSWDTTRADALSAWASDHPWGEALPGVAAAGRTEGVAVPQPATPVADRLATQGVRFAWALAHAPTTLNSHTSMFSGLDPHAHGVVRNGFPVEPHVALLPEAFTAAGWHTIAVVGSSALERSMGLDRGFAVYDDAVSAEVRKRHEDRADRVTHRALTAVDNWLATDPQAPLFLFVHYYDAHSPWTNAPDDRVAPFLDPAYTGEMDGTGTSIVQANKQLRAGTADAADLARLRALYLAQVAWLDEQLGVLLTGLDDRGLGSSRLTVLTADHGELLEEHDERGYGHGIDVDLGAIHVPLVVHGSGRFAAQVPAGAEVQTPARLMDLASTIAARVGLDGPVGQGVDLAPRWSEAPPQSVPPSFAEATKPTSYEDPARWNNLPFERAVVHDGYMLLRFPLEGNTAHLYRLAHGQPVASGQTRRVGAMVKQLAAWDAQAPAHRDAELTPETTEALRALGYLDD